jgi:hypothetical protein
VGAAQPKIKAGKHGQSPNSMKPSKSGERFGGRELKLSFMVTKKSFGEVWKWRLGINQVGAKGEKCF